METHRLDEALSDGWPARLIARPSPLRPLVQTGGTV
jgi:hypothetical protein